MSCDCVICKNQKPFLMPDEIINAAKQENLAIFCGAGISTENKNVLPFSFYTTIKNELDDRSEDISFSEVMEKYCVLPNGRRKLTQKILERFDYIHSFPEIEDRATMFHKELAELYFVNTIITTNWDTYFEQYCDAIPIVIPPDFTFWDNRKRCVMKIHGSINNLSTIVATKTDYIECEKNLSKGILGSTLKTILATKTLLFIGFSFGDEDFNQILRFIEEEMKEYTPHIYIVTLDENLSQKMQYKKHTCINTDGTYFIHQLKMHFSENGLIEHLSKRDIISYTRELVSDVHNDVAKVDFKKYPQSAFCLAYQDGILHSFDRFIQMYNSGQYFRPGYLETCIYSYENLKKEHKKNNNYWDYAYYEGYQQGLLFIAMCDKDEKLIERFPIFYIPNSINELVTYKEFGDELERVERINGKYKRYANKLVEGYTDTNIVLHHPPY